MLRVLKPQGLNLGRFYARLLSAAYRKRGRRKALWKLPELWKNQRTVFPQLLEPSVHNFHNAGCCWITDTTFLLLPEFPRLAGRAWSAGLPDEHGGRCHERNAGSSGEGRDDVGGSRRVAGLD